MLLWGLTLALDYWARPMVQLEALAAKPQEETTFQND